MALSDDFELLTRSSHDAAAFRVLFDRWSIRIEGFFRRRTGDADDALDLTAEAFASLWLSRERVEDRFDGDIGPWLYGICRNVLRRSARSKQIESRALERLGETNPSGRHVTPAADQWLEGLDEDLADALRTLASAQATAVLLRVAHDLGYDDVADALGVSSTAARIKVSRGLSTLRARLDKGGPRHD